MQTTLKAYIPLLCVYNGTFFVTRMKNHSFVTFNNQKNKPEVPIRLIALKRDQISSNEVCDYLDIFDKSKVKIKTQLTKRFMDQLG